MPIINIITMEIYICSPKKYYRIVIFFIPLMILSQNAEKIKESDTIYIYFKSDKNQFKGSNNRIVSTDLNYFYLNFSIINPKSSISFIHHYRISPEEKKKKNQF